MVPSMVSRKVVAISATIVAFGLWSEIALGDNDTPRVRDEWEHIERIFISTIPDGNTGARQLNATAKVVIGAAIKAGVKPVISDHDKTARTAILDDLKTLNLIQKDSDVHIIENPFPTDWARDAAPIVTFDPRKRNTAIFSGTTFRNDAESQRLVSTLAKSIGLPSRKLPEVKFPAGFTPPTLPLSIDGGDWMTTGGGRTLVTTTAVYDNNGDGTGTVRDAVKAAVDATLKTNFGIQKIIELTPIKADAKEVDGDGNPTGRAYSLRNTHVDLQVRTLPANKVIVADVPAGDPQHQALDDIATKLRGEGFTVVRVQNAPQGAGNTLLFKTYTNALFLNKTIAIPKYGDAAADAAAKAAYERALPGYKVIQIDAAESIKFCGAARCAAREGPASPSKKVGKEASSRSNPRVSFDALSGALSFVPATINFLGSPGDPLTSPGFGGDPFDGATLEISGLTFDTLMSAEDRYSFSGGHLRIIGPAGADLLTASVPVFTVFGQWPSEALRMAGPLADIVVAEDVGSSWFDAFVAEVLDDPALLADLFAEVPVDLIDLSMGFTRGFQNVELTSLGIAGNGSVAVQAPRVSSLLLGALLLMAASTANRRPSVSIGAEEAYLRQYQPSKAVASSIPPFDPLDEVFCERDVFLVVHPCVHAHGTQRLCERGDHHTDALTHWPGERPRPVLATPCIRGEVDRTGARNFTRL